MTDEERECIFWQRVLQKCKGVEQQRKRRLKRLFKNWMPITFVKGNCFGTPLYTTCKSNEGGNKDPSLRNKGRSWYEGGGGADTRRKGLMWNFM